jgi:hypothetical protein
MRFKFALGLVVAAGLFTLGGSEASAQAVSVGPSTALVGGRYYGGVGSPAYYSRYASPFVTYGVPSYGYYPGGYYRGGTSFGFSYNSGGFYNQPYYGGYNRGYYGGYGRGYNRGYYGRPGVSFGFSTFR